MTSEPLKAANLSYLMTPPQACGETPSVMRPQLLALRSLGAKDFERLCYRLTRLHGTVEQVRIFGVEGQSQGGIDLYARKRDGTYLVVQCKRSTDTFTPGEVTSAVDTFLNGEWAAKADEFVLAVTDRLERTQVTARIEEERPRLTSKGITFTVWDQTELCALLKDQPRLVDDFFGREAVRVFVGNDAAVALGTRLDAAEVVEFRQQFGSLYRTVFGRFEHGMHGPQRNVPLDARFVLPDIVVSDDLQMSTAPTPGGAMVPDLATSSRRDSYFPDVLGGLRDPRAVAAPVRAYSSVHSNRVGVTDWLSTGERHLVVGAPGAGKSALLRMLVLDLFCDEPRFTAGVDHFQDVLPVWFPFAFWTSAASKNARSISVLDGVREWLSAYDHEGLWPLIEKALHDERVLLVVDGLDEWATPDAARLCIDRLEVFADTKRARVLASSRPFSSAELPLDPDGWRMSTLAPLDRAQRLSFVTKWLTPVIEESALPQEAARWSAEIESSPHLRELADLPLFLSLLLRSKEQRTEFPEDLHAVLDDVIDRMVGEHRQRKIVTSGTRDVFPSNGDIHRVSGAAAEKMHRTATITMSDDNLRATFRSTLVDEIGYPAPEAHATAQALVNALSPGVGLMIRPAPDETQFFHRSVLEFLTAQRLLTLSGDQVMQVAVDHLTDRRWSQVVRFMIRGITRPPEIVEMFARLDVGAANNPLLREATDLLAAEVAVGAGSVDAPMRRRLLERVVAVVETGEREAHRAALLDRLVTGLSRREVRGELSTRFGTWLHAYPRETWGAALRAASTWPADDVLHTVLWHALHADEDDVQRLAGRLLGTKFAGDDTVAGRLADLACITRLPGRRAAATEALSLCAPAHPALDSLIATGSSHPHFAVRHACVGADLRRGNTTEANRDALITLLDGAPQLSAWSDSIMELMFEHYPDDQVIFEHYLREADPAVDRPHHRRNSPATFLLFKGYPLRAETRQYFQRYLSPARTLFPDSPNLLIERVPWPQIAEAYSDDPEMVSAVEGFLNELLRSSLGQRGTYFCSLVARTPSVRDRLLTRLRRDDRWGIGWIVRALLEGWPNDPEVHAILLDQLDSGSTTHRNDGLIARLSDIITDPEEALTHLEALAPTAMDAVSVVRALEGIVNRGIDRADPRVEALVQQALADQKLRLQGSTERALFEGFMHHRLVRDRAAARLNAHDTPLAAIVYGARDEPDLRHNLAAQFGCVSPPLRGRLIEALANAPISDGTATILLGGYDAEPDATVKMLAATAFARRLVESQSPTAEALANFTEQARAIGPDLDERRGAAFCALAELGRLDVLTDMREHSDGRPVQIQHGHGGDTQPFYRYVCRFWADTKTALGSNFATRFGFDNSSDQEFFQNILAVAHDYPDIRTDLLTLLADRPELAGTAQAVSYLQRIRLTNSDSWVATTNLLVRANAWSYHDIEQAWTALHVLTEQFGTDPRTEQWLNKQLAQFEKYKIVNADTDSMLIPSYGVLAALARLRPDHDLLAMMLAATARPEAGLPWRTFPEWTELATATTSDAQQFVDLALEITRIVTRSDNYSGYIHHPLAYRLRRDHSLAAELAQQIPHLSDAAVGIAIRLLWLSGHFDGTVAEYVKEIAEGKQRASSWAVDPLTGQTGHLHLLALNILDTLHA
ncbi:NACHT domain-containing protein [Umezawaea sp. Da 62-37]|uniref:NACHT domain-containing protein n=1 Tax=Umezawaea sp. Da 62-37 TaxID=3075927 RepID=UPI0028F73B64|nr:NACHT domain-containing protein [Umezawaea sp. Da 62-37]WNV84718.1 NACHT domain-containing protein [Umezawaea sp. Da 62-37]